MALGRQYKPPLGRSMRCATSATLSKPGGTSGSEASTPGRSSTTKWQSDANSPARCQDGTSASASRPINQTKGSPPPPRSVNESTVYVGPGRTTSKSDARRPASCRVARCNIRHRSRTPARGADRCPGRAASISVTSGISRAARARRAAWRWPRWTGSKVPPRIAFTPRQPFNFAIRRRISTRRSLGDCICSRLCRVSASKGRSSANRQLTDRASS